MTPKNQEKPAELEDENKAPEGVLKYLTPDLMIGAIAVVFVLVYVAAKLFGWDS